MYMIPRSEIRIMASRRGQNLRICPPIGCARNAAPRRTCSTKFNFPISEWPLTKYLIIGGGVAGVTAAQTILPLDPAADVTILSAEPYPYYFRPRLWEFIAGQAERPALFFRQPEWYEAQKIHLASGVRVEAIQPTYHSVATSNGSVIGYDRLLLATGALPFTPSIPGTDKAGVFTLRSLGDADAIRNYLQGRTRAVVVGGGLLGLETARALATAGLAVTVLETAPHLLPRQLDAQGGEVMRACLERTGLHIHTGCEPKAIIGEAETAGVELTDGQRLDCGLVVFSTGIVPDIRLARSAWLGVRRGILVDDRMQTSNPNIFAAGDAAEHRGVVYGLIQPSIEQARVAGANMAGGSATYPGTAPSASLKIAGVEMASMGESISEIDPNLVLRRMDAFAATYRKLVFAQDGSLQGAILINEKENVLPIRKLIASHKVIAGEKDQLLAPNYNFLALTQANAA
jgi:nitrite reductase (NADH) large subunit